MTYFQRIESIALITRVIFLLLSAIANFVLPDHESDGFESPSFNIINSSFSDKIVLFLLGGLHRWDAHHFLHIAKEGYTYENNLAFFPLYPNILKLCSVIIEYITGLNSLSCYLISATVINTIFFVKSVMALYKLSVLVFNDKKHGFNAALFFCISPATVFFIAPYSESLFSLCTFKGMLSYIKGDIAYASLWFALGTYTRSNGIINVGFILHYYLSQAIVSFKCHQWTVTFFQNIVRFVWHTFLSTTIIVAPFIIFQFDGREKFCYGSGNFSEAVVNYAVAKNLVLPGANSSWCQDTMVMPYSYVQSHYWDVGFLKYYTLQQLPNFCLALPVICIIFSFGTQFLYKQRKLFWHPERILEGKEIVKHDAVLLPRKCFVFFVHAYLLTIFCLLNINVQVITRILSSASPILYWIITGNLLIKGCNKAPHFNFLRVHFICFKDHFVNNWCLPIIRYFFIYAIVGTVLFSNNFPWT